MSLSTPTSQNAEPPFRMRDFANTLLAGPKPSHRPPCLHDARVRPLSPITKPVADAPAAKVDAAPLNPLAALQQALFEYGGKREGFKGPASRFIDDVLSSCGSAVLDYLSDPKHDRDDNTRARAYEAMRDMLIRHADGSQYFKRRADEEGRGEQLAGDKFE